jgi:hypothetical protein
MVSTCATVRGAIALQRRAGPRDLPLAAPQNLAGPTGRQAAGKSPVPGDELFSRAERPDAAERADHCRAGAGHQCLPKLTMSAGYTLYAGTESTMQPEQ